MTEEQIDNNNQKSMNQINQLKVEIFDIMRQQEILNNQISQLQNLKLQKAEQLQKLEASEAPFHMK